MQYASSVVKASEIASGVSYRLARISFGRRLDLVRRLHEKLRRIEYLEAGDENPARDAEAASLTGEVNKEYLRWGLLEVEGLEIDGEPANAESLVENGPEDLVHECLAFVLAEAGLSSDERKNSEPHSTSPSATRPGGNAATVEERVWKESATADGLARPSMPTSSGSVDSRGATASESP